VRRLRPEQIVVFAQQDTYGDAGFDGVAKAVRALRSGRDGEVLRLNYKRNTIDVDEAVAQLRKLRTPPRAVVMVATYRAAAKFIEKTRDINPPLIYTNVSFVGSTALAEELMLLGAKYANGVIVTQVVPAVDSYSNVVLEYKTALSASFPAKPPTTCRLRVTSRQCHDRGPETDRTDARHRASRRRSGKLARSRPRAWYAVEFRPHRAPGIHKVWGTQLDAQGRYQPIELQ